MTLESDKSFIRPDKPWLSLVVCGKGDCDRVKAAGQAAREQQGEIIQEVTVVITQNPAPVEKDNKLPGQ